MQPESAPEFLGSSPIPHHLASVNGTKAPFLPPLSRASLILRTSPPPLPTRSPKLTGQPGQGLPVSRCLSFHACYLHYPGKTLSALSGKSPERNGLPRFRGGSALALRILGPAQRSLRAAACRVAKPDYSDSIPAGSMLARYQGHHASVPTEASRRFLGRDLPPLENSRLSRGSLNPA
jgi:hypothetical protein